MNFLMQSLYSPHESEDEIRVEPMMEDLKSQQEMV